MVLNFSDFQKGASDYYKKPKKSRLDAERTNKAMPYLSAIYEENKGTQFDAVACLASQAWYRYKKEHLGKKKDFRNFDVVAQYIEQNKIFKIRELERLAGVPVRSVSKWLGKSQDISNHNILAVFFHKLPICFKMFNFPLFSNDSIGVLCCF